MTHRQLNRATLERQMLLERRSLDPIEALRRLGLVQAQEPASVYLSLWNRLTPFDPASLDRAIHSGQVVRGTSIRITLHLAEAQDWSVFHRAMEASLRASRLFDRRFVTSGFTPAEVEALVPGLVAFAQEARSDRELEDWVSQQLGRPGRWAWWALRTFGPWNRVPDPGPWSFGRDRGYRTARPPEDLPSPDEAVERLLVRYLAAFGPATARDFCRFTLLRSPVVADAVRALGPGLIRLRGPEGEELLDLPGLRLPDQAVPAPPRLLPMWDSPLLAYDDPSRIYAPGARALVARNNGDLLPPVLVDGLVSGLWRLTEGGVEVTAFRHLSDAEWEGLEDEARPLVEFLRRRDPGVYRRYDHWWTKGISGAVVRVLGS